jgi:DnaJ-class molecular chaperone
MRQSFLMTPIRKRPHEFLLSYEVLSDPEKRSIYDARGEAGLSEQGGMDPHVCAIAHFIRPNLHLSSRTCLANYLGAEAVSSEVEVDHKDLARRKTSFTVFTFPLKTFTRGRRLNLL